MSGTKFSSAAFRPARVQVFFDTGRYRQPPKHKGMLCESHSAPQSRFVQIYQHHADATRWYVRSASTQWNDGSRVDSHMVPNARGGYSKDQAMALAARFCETGSFDMGAGDA